MNLITKFKNINLMIFINNELILSGNKNYFVNFPKSALDEIPKSFFVSPRLQEKLGGIYKKIGFTVFSDSLFYKVNNSYVFFDVYGLYSSYLKGALPELGGGFQYGFLFGRKIYIFHEGDIDEVLTNICYSFSGDIYRLLYKMNKNGNSKILVNDKLSTKKSIFLMKLCKFIPQVTPGIVVEIGENTITKTHSIFFPHKRLSFPKNFISSEYLISQKKNIKLDTGFLAPVKSIGGFGDKQKDIGFGYSGNFGIADKHYLFSDEELNFSTGFDFYNLKASKAKAFCEGIERFNSGYFSSDKVETDYWGKINKELTEKILGFDLSVQKADVHKFTQMFQITSTSEIAIERGLQRIRIPHELIFYPSIPKEHRIYFANSSGVGAGRSYEEALMGGLFELSERDSLMLTWLLKLSPDIFNNNSLPANLRKKIGDIENRGKGKIYIFDIAYDKTFPHILVIHKKVSGGFFGVGASCGFNLEKVIEKALSEAAVSAIFGKESMKEIDFFNDVKTVQDHKDFYSKGKNCEIFLNFLFKNNQIISFPRKDIIFSQQIGSILEILEKIVGGRYFIANLTTQYSKSLGIYVVRVLSESLIPIWFGSEAKLPLKKERLKQYQKFEKWKKCVYSNDIPDFLHFFD